MIKDFDKKDSSELIALWQTCFGDEREFIESFFENFCAGMKVGVHREDGKIVSALYCLPAQLVLDGRKIKAWYLYAVATLPGYRKRGYAGDLIDEVKNLEDGANALFLTPSDEKNRKFYESLGFSDRFYSNCFEFEKTEKASGVELKRRKDENLFLIREKNLGSNAHVSWDEKHLEFAFGKDVLIACKNGETVGYLHFEKKAQNLVAHEVCIGEKYLEDTLNSVCEFFGIKKVKVCTQNAENCCKNSKGMLYCKFDSVEKILLEKQIYLGVNLE